MSEVSASKVSRNGRRAVLSLLGAIAVLACTAGTARAAHFRYGTMAWTVPDPIGAPRTVAFTVTIGVTTTSAPTLPIVFGDATPNVNMTGTSIGTGTDAVGSTYYVYQYTTTHTYAGDGPYTAYHESSARVAGLVNGANGTYRIQAVIALGGSPVNTGGPTTGSPSIVMLQAGGVRTFTWPVFDPDGDSFSCRFGTTAESRLPATPTDQTVPKVPTGGAVPTLAATANGCTMTWDLTSATAGQTYVVHIEFESTHNGVKSSSDIDTIAQITTGAPPEITGSGVFTAQAGQALTVPFSATWVGGTMATVSTVGLPSGATVTPGGTGTSPFANSLQWTPPVTERGKTKVVLVSYKTTTNLVGTGYALINVLPCASVCSGATPVCDPITQTCVACLSDAHCAAPTPRCTTGRVCAACITDAHCATGNWCNDLTATTSCDAEVANGQPVPGGTCTSTLGARACVTGVCDADNLCGWATGTAGCTANTSAVECRTGMCASDGTCGAGPPASIAVSGGGTQTATVGTVFGSALQVLVKDATGLPVKNATVTFAAPSSGASAQLSATTASTDATGRASVTATAKTIAGSYTVTASVAGVATVATFVLSNGAGPAAAIAADAGGGQTAAVGAAFVTALTALVTDGYGNPVNGVTVSFSSPAAGASAALGGATAITNAAGRASVTATANGVAGSYAVTASTAGVAAPASFMLGNLPGSPAAVAMVSGDAQSVAVGAPFAPLVVVARDSFGNAVPGATVTFTPPGSGASAVLGSTSAVAGANGQASTSATANTVAGSFSVVASVGGATVSFALTSQPGAAASVAVVSGGGQSQVVGMAYAAPLVVVVRDAYANAVPGVAVTFTAPASGASGTISAGGVATTDASGRAGVSVVANANAGGFAVAASATGVATPASFTLTNTAGAPAQLTLEEGDAQSVAVTETFPKKIRVAVRDASGNLVPAGVVGFVAPAPGAGVATASLSASAVATGVDGIAEVTAVANTVAGAYDVTVNAAGTTPLTVKLTNQPGAAASVAPTPGSTPQAATVRAAFERPLSAIVSDAYGNAVPGVAVAFAAPAAAPNASLSAATSTTDATGKAEVTATAAAEVGGYSVIASVAGVTDTAAFVLSNVSGEPAKVEVVSGTPQSATVASAFAQPLTVKVSDADGNPVPGATVSFTAYPAAGGATATLSAAAVSTSATGEAQVAATAGTVAGAHTVTAQTAGGAHSVAFTLTNVAGAAARIEADARSTPQAAQVGAAYAQPLVATVTDAHGNAVAGVKVTFAPPASGATAALSAATGDTNAAGQVSVNVTAGQTAGAFAVDAAAAGVASPAAFMLRNLTGPPNNITVASGSGQSAEVTKAFGAPLVVELRDAFGNPVPAVTLTVTRPGAGASATVGADAPVTGADGRASIAATATATAGAYAVTVGSDAVATPAIFMLTNTPGAPAEIAATAGSTPQTAEVEHPFAQPLGATVKDAHGNLVPGAKVSFTAPASGARALLAAPDAVTDASGVASVSATAGDALGSYAVTASVDATTLSATYALTNVAGPPATLMLVSGGSQHARAGAAFELPIVLAVRDSHGLPVAGAAVSIALPATGASASATATSATSDAQGEARVTLTANDVPGAFQATASVAGAAAPVTVPLTVDAVPTTTTLQVDPSQVEEGGTVNLTAMVSSDAGAPAGQVKFVLADGTVLGTAALAAGQATLKLTATPALLGQRAVTTRFEAQGRWAASESAPVTLTVLKKPDTGSLGGAGGCSCALGGESRGFGGASAAVVLLAALVARRRKRA